MGSTEYVSRATNEDLERILAYAGRPGMISLAGGLPDPSVFPREELSEIAGMVIGEMGQDALQYSAAMGVPKLRERISRYMEEELGIGGQGPDSVLVTTGSQESLFSISMSLLREGDAVFTENPTYFVAYTVFREFGARVRPSPMEEDGIDTHSLEAAVRSEEPGRRKFIYVMPVAQNPTGASMGEEKKRHILEIASQYDLMVIEDDPYGLINYSGARPRPLKSMDGEGRVIYLSTFSKVLAPGLRIGWAAGDPGLLSSVSRVKQLIDLNTNTLSQYICSEALERRLIQRNIGRVVEAYRRKRDWMDQALRSEFGDRVSYVLPDSGMFIFARFQGVDTRKMVMRAVESGVLYLPGDSTFVSDPDYSTARLNFSYPGREEISEGIRRLGRVFRPSSP
ncbi:aminotransferase-like domain-containing protein [Thermogymnomonas acidicola]|nr:PLP-dependent aminotransferase family protein [Thermogymnomonas acidicola]